MYFLQHFYLTFHRWTSIIQDHSIWKNLFEMEFGGVRDDRIGWNKAVQMGYQNLKEIYDDAGRLKWVISNQHLQTVRRLLPVCKHMLNIPTLDFIPIHVAAKIGNPYVSDTSSSFLRHNLMPTITHYVSAYIVAHNEITNLSRKSFFPS
jgi:hypothetical protein